LEHLKRLEGEVLDLLASLGEMPALKGPGLSVDPHQVLGIEANPRAAAITELVLWIGYLQWHFRIQGNAEPAEPVLRNFRNIEHRGALLTWREELVRGPDRRPLSRWDGRTRKPHPMTGKMVPDDEAKVEVMPLIGAQPAKWPKAHFIIGNPPFIGGKEIRAVQGEGYAEALWDVYRQMPQSADYVMYWWHRAAQEASYGRTLRFGLITTNSLPQAFNRRVVQAHLDHVNGFSLSRQSRNQTGGRRQHSSSAVRAILDDPPIHIVCSRKRGCEGQEPCGFNAFQHAHDCTPPPPRPQDSSHVLSRVSS
jgi:hypothetical protein